MGLLDKLKKGVSSLAGAAMAPSPPDEQPAALEEDDDDAQRDDDPATRAEWSVNSSLGWGRYYNGPPLDPKDRGRLHPIGCARCSPYFGHLDPDDLENFCLVGFELEEAEAEGAEALEAKLHEHGLSDKEEWWRIMASFILRHYSGISTEEVGDHGGISAGEAADRHTQTMDQHTQTMLNARARQGMRAREQAAAADPTLLAPFEGVTVEGWAKAAAALGSETDATRQAQLLVRLGMDSAKWQRVNDEFQARMQRDTSFVIAQAFGKAFSEAQGVSGGFGLGAVDGSLQQLGAEPVSFERYTEYMGAMAAWGQSGADVNANLKQHFGITAMDISKFSSYWATRFQADFKLARKHSDLADKYCEQYRGAGGHDDDLAV